MRFYDRVNELAVLDGTGIVAEVKRNRDKISMTKLADKVQSLLGKDFGRYQLKLYAFSMENM